MNKQDEFSIVRKALKKLHPKWLLFIDEVMDLLFPFWEGTHWEEHVHFIHLIGYGKRQKAREILTDLIELLDWQHESAFLWNNWDINSPSPFSQVTGFQLSYTKFPKVVLTDYLNEFFANAVYEEDTCEDYDRVKEFLRTGRELDFQPGIAPLDARGGLIISFIDSFGDSDFIRTRVMFQFLLDNPITYVEVLRKSYVPDNLKLMIEKGYVFSKELVFFSKDEPKHIQLAFDLILVKGMLEEKGSELLKLKVHLSKDAMDCFLSYIFYQKLSASLLRQAALDFFTPVFWQYPRMIKNVNPKPSQVEIDFTGGWNFKSIYD